MAIYLIGLCSENILLPNTIPSLVMDSLLRWRDEIIYETNGVKSAHSVAPNDVMNVRLFSLVCIFGQVF